MLRVEDLGVEFGDVRALVDLTLEVPLGPYGVGLVGESGSGKSTLARAALALLAPSAGRVTFLGQDVSRLRGEPLRAFRRQVQVVMQDSDGGLNPRMTVGSAIREVLTSHAIVPRVERKGEVAKLLTEVGLDTSLADRYPHQLSGGQRQRISIARALALRPQMLVLDEPTSALDVTVQAKVLDLIERLRYERRLSYLLISHNLAIVDRLCERIEVLYLGRVVESGPTQEVLSTPAHPYTAALRSAVPQVTQEQPEERLVLTGTVPDATHRPPGCAFASRCPIAIDRCHRERPHTAPIGRPGHLVACHRAREVLQGTVSLAMPPLPG
jgi:oligopeptide/dipeptide ABC transporter ATP-binding protein